MFTTYWRYSARACCMQLLILSAHFWLFLLWPLIKWENICSFTGWYPSSCAVTTSAGKAKHWNKQEEKCVPLWSESAFRTMCSTYSAISSKLLVKVTVQLALSIRQVYIQNVRKVIWAAWLLGWQSRSVGLLVGLLLWPRLKYWMEFLIFYIFTVESFDVLSSFP